MAEEQQQEAEWEKSLLEKFTSSTASKGQFAIPHTNKIATCAFTASRAVDFVCDKALCTRDESVAICQRWQSEGHIVPITDQNDCLRDGSQLFRLSSSLGGHEIAQEGMVEGSTLSQPLSRPPHHILIAAAAKWPATTDLERVRKILRNEEININDHITGQGFTLLHLACARRNLQFLRLLVEEASYRTKNKLDLNCIDVDGHSPLHVACRSGSVNVVRTLLDLAVNVRIRNRVGTLPGTWLSS